MGAYTCEYGTVHKMCRCPTPHTIACPTPAACQETTGAGPNGTWIRKPDAPHVCRKPKQGPLLGPPIRTGDIWACTECRTEWKVTVMHDQRDDQTWFEWA